MLAEKFMLLLETIISNRHLDNSSQNRTKCRHVPVKLPNSDIEANPPDSVVPFRKPCRDGGDRCRQSSNAANIRQQ